MEGTSVVPCGGLVGWGLVSEGEVGVTAIEFIVLPVVIGISSPKYTPSTEEYDALIKEAHQQCKTVGCGEPDT